MGMRTLLLLLALVGSACVTAPTTEDKALAPDYIRGPAQAVAVVRRDIEAHGGKAEASDYRAGRRGTQWFVTAWHIRHPEAKGAARFEPGGFTTYLLNNRGRIIEKLRGR